MSCLLFNILGSYLGVTWELFGSYLGVNWELHGRNVFVSLSFVLCFPIVSKRSLSSSFSLHSLIFRTVLDSPSLVLCFTIDAKSKFYRCQSEGKAKVKRRSIEELSKNYRRAIEELSKSYRSRSLIPECKVTKSRKCIFTFLVISGT